MKNLFLVHLLFSTFFLSAQNKRDLIIKDSILSTLNSNKTLQKSDYVRVKKIIISLDESYGYETELHKRLLDFSVFFDDLLFFKSELTLLINKYGFNVAYLTGEENYYNLIFNGDLKVWFKKMYIENHSIWLENNFEKQVDFRKLNEIRIKDQLINTFASKLFFSKIMDSVQKKLIQSELNTFNFNNIGDLYGICKKYDKYPTDKSFSVIQNNFGSTLVHNFQQQENIEKTWMLLFPFIKKAYLNYEIDNVVFKNYDFYLYTNFGFQDFNSYNISQIPEEFKKNNIEIPLRNKELFEKIKKEFNWQ